MINIDKWNQYIKADSGYHFHLWAPDIAMQFLNNNVYNITIPWLYCLNCQELKEKYNIPVNSAKASMNGDIYYFGEYDLSHETWRKKWKWNYETVTINEEEMGKYRGTLIERFYNHNITKGPLETFEL